jgi:hypothetical protein
MRIAAVALGFPCALALGLVHPVLAVAAAVALALFWTRQRRLLIGAQGEDMALGYPTALPGSLATLPDDYIVFNQLRVPWLNTVLEIDHVVVGPNGVFNVECKHMVGEIEGADHARKWTQRKRGAGSVSIEREFRNPILQVKRSSHALARYLRARGIHVWVSPIVVFTHPAARVRATSNSTPLLKLEQLAPCIAMSDTRYAYRHQAAVTRALKRLCDEDGGHAELRANGLATTTSDPRSGGPHHISYFMRDLIPERVQAFMTHDLAQARKEARREEKLAARNRASTPPIPQTYAPAPRPLFKRRPRFTIVRGGATGVFRRRRMTVHTVLRSVETVQTEETDENEICF